MALCCVKIQQPSNLCLSLSDLCTSSLYLMKLTRQTHSTTYHDQSPGIRPPTAAARATTRGQRLLELSHAPPKILDFQLGSQPHALPRWPCRPPIYLAWESGDLTNLHVPTRAAGYMSRHHAPELAFTRLPRTEEQMLMSSGDIVTPRLQPCKHLHISPNPRQWHVIGWRQRLCCSTHDPNRKPGTDLDQYPLTLTLDPLTLTFVLTFDQKSKFPTRPILLSFSRRFQFWTPFLRLKLQNWSIGTFFIVVSSKALFMASSRDLLMLIQPQAFMSFCLEFEGGC